MLNALPIELLIREIAPIDYTVYYALVVGYPRFARALTQIRNLQNVEPHLPDGRL